MTQPASDPEQGRADRLTRKWWFILAYTFGLNMIPPMVTRWPAEQQFRLDRIYTHIFSNAIGPTPPSRMWVAFDILPILLVLALIAVGARVSRILSAYAAVTYVLFGLFQNVSVTERYGVGIVTCNVAWCLIIAGFWAWEASVGLNDFAPRRRSLWQYWVVPFALFAFWVPIRYHHDTASFHFMPLAFLRDHTGLAFCLMTPVYLAILALYHPTVNPALMRVTGLAGIVVAFWNMVTAFVFTHNWYHAVTHLPLTLLSIYAVVLSFRSLPPADEPGHSQRRDSPQS